MKILVADDDPVVLKLLTTGLRKRGYEVETATDAMQVGMAAMRESPDAVVLDINMPGGTGLAALKRLKMSTKTNMIPVIAITGSATEEAQAEALEMGALDCLEKPVEVEDLAQRLAEVVGET